MKKNIPKKVADALGATAFETALMKNSDGTAIKFLIVVPPDMNALNMQALENVLSESVIDETTPDMICLARSLSAWCHPFIVNSENLTDGSRDPSSISLPRKLIELKSGNQEHGTLILLAGEDLYSEMVKHMNFPGPVYAIDNSFYFIKLTSAYKTKSLYQHFNLGLFSEKYFQCIKAANLCGPIYLGGFSLGGNIAIELAKKLKNDRKAVSDVFLFDTFTPESVRKAPRFRWIFRHSQQLKKRGFIHLKEISINVMQRLEWFSLGKKITGKPPRIHGIHRDRDLVRLFHNTEYYDGKVRLFRSNSFEPYIPPEIDYGWSKFVLDLEIISLNGAHGEFMQVNAVKLASSVDATIIKSNQV